MIPTSVPPVYVASDGEVTFDPFGAGYDTSDGIVLNSNWIPDPAFAGAFVKGFWTQITASAPGLPWDGMSAWVLPASTPCGNENEPKCEPVAKWDFGPGTGWNPGTPRFVKLWESDGTTLSDIILLANNGPNGAATISFASDPSIPEPSTWAMLPVGFAGLGFAGYRWSGKRLGALVA